MIYKVIHGFKGLKIIPEVQDINFWNDYTIKAGSVLTEDKMGYLLSGENELQDSIDYTFSVMIGQINFKNLINNVCLIKDLETENSYDLDSELEYDCRLIQLFLFCTWIIKDNAINLSHSYLYSNEKELLLPNVKAINFTTSRSSSNTTDFSQIELKQAIEFFYKYILNESPRNARLRSEIENGMDPLGILKELLQPNPTTPPIAGQIINTEQNSKVFHYYTFDPYNNYDRITRSIQFIAFARSQSEPTLKIVFYILFLEILLSRSNSKISENLRTRTALLISKSQRENSWVIERVKSAYGIRSKYVHGSKMSFRDNQVDFIIQLSADIDCICRSLFVCIKEKHSEILNLESENEITVYINYLKN